MPNRNMSVLIVEDNLVQAQMVEIILESRTEVKYHTEIVGTAKDAEERLQRGGIDVVLLALGLPDGGTEQQLIGRIKAAAKDIGIVVLTGSGENLDELERTVKNAGADELLLKPSTPSEVSKKLQFVVIQHRSDKKRHELEELITELNTRILLSRTPVNKQLSDIKEIAQDTQNTVEEIKERLEK